MINSKTNLKEFVTETGGLRSECVEEIENPAAFELSNIQRGLILVFARWSPFPMLCLQRMRDIVPNRLAQAKAKLYIIDNDKLDPREMERLFGKVLHGGAETFAVVGGRVRAESTGCPKDYEAVILKLCDVLSQG